MALDFSGFDNLLEEDVYNGEMGHALKHNMVNDQVNFLTEQLLPFATADGNLEDGLRGGIGRGYSIADPAFGTLSDNPETNRTVIQTALNALGEHDELYIPAVPASIGTSWVVDDVLYFPSRCRIHGPGLLEQVTPGLPCLASKSWDSTSGAPTSGFVELDVRVKTVAGDLDAHGVILRDFFSTVSVVVEGCGGDGLHMTTRNNVGAEVGGTLVENRVKRLDVRDAGGWGMWAGHDSNNKLTDGRLDDYFIRGAGGLGDIYIGSAAGWQFGRGHVYGPRQNGIVISNGFHTDLGDIYTEDGVASGSPIVLANCQRNVLVGRVTVGMPDRDDEAAIDVTKSGFSPGDGVTITSMQLALDHNRTAYAVRNSDPAVPVVIGTLVKNGAYKSQIGLATGFGASGVRSTDQLGRAGTALTIEGRAMPLSARGTWDAGGAKSIDLTIVDPPFFGSITGLLLIHGPQFNNLGQLVSYAAQFSISAKDVSDAQEVYLNEINAPIGFTTPPAISRPAANTLRITFEPDNAIVFGGVVSVIYSIA